MRKLWLKTCGSKSPPSRLFNLRAIILLLPALIIVTILATACGTPTNVPTPTPTSLPGATLTPPPTETAVPTNLPTPPINIPAQVISYNLGDDTIIQDNFPEDSRFRNMPVRLEGVIGVPGSEGPHPVVLIMHGSHVICPDDIWPCSPEEEQKNYEGYAYLVQALAEAGYVALSINVNAEHTYGYGEGVSPMRTTQLIDLHLGELAAANAGESDKFGIDLTGRVDLANMVWMGHSRGADLINWIVREQNLATSASPVGYGPVAGFILISPPFKELELLPVVDLPFAVIMPACDGDVIDQRGQFFYESARLAEDRTDFATSVYLEGANHNYFNAILEAEQPDPLANRPDCTAEKLLTAEDQQEFLTQYTFDFLRQLADSSEQAEVAAPPVVFPLGETQPAMFFDGDAFIGNVHMSSLRIPLASLTAVDLTQITEIALIFDQTPSGTLFWADLELVK